jgi:AraC-like DNA-binding protein
VPRQLANDAHHERLIASQPVMRDAELFARYLQIVALMSQQNTASATRKRRPLLRACRCARSRLWRLAKPARVCSVAWQLQAPPTLDSLAHEFALRKETLIRAFKQDTGLTPASFINMARIEFQNAPARRG